MGEEARRLIVLVLAVLAAFSSRLVPNCGSSTAVLFGEVFSLLRRHFAPAAGRLLGSFGDGEVLSFLLDFLKRKR